MNFRTTISINNPDFEISHQSKITCLGSCFAEHIGAKLAIHKMDILNNPIGIMYNPISLAKGIDYAINNIKVSKNELFEQQERWVHYDFHSELSSLEKGDTVGLINGQVSMFHKQLVESDILIVSLGTAFVFRNIETGNIVNNCHKMPGKLFDRKLLSLSEVTRSLDEMFNDLWKVNPKLKIITTISPVRHIRDGLVENQRSKSTLHLAVQNLNEVYENMHYFPSYEIMLDDLRDYRFYNRDKLHPSVEAIDYIWKLFEDNFCSRETKTKNKQILDINRAMSHRPFNPSSDVHGLFKQAQLSKIENLIKQIPDLDFEKEIDFFKS